MGAVTSFEEYPAGGSFTYRLHGRIMSVSFTTAREEAWDRLCALDAPFRAKFGDLEVDFSDNILCLSSAGKKYDPIALEVGSGDDDSVRTECAAIVRSLRETLDGVDDVY